MAIARILLSGAFLPKVTDTSSVELFPKQYLLLLGFAAVIPTNTSLSFSKQSLNGSSLKHLLRNKFEMVINRFIQPNKKIPSEKWNEKNNDRHLAWLPAVTDYASEAIPMDNPGPESFCFVKNSKRHGGIPPQRNKGEAGNSQIRPRSWAKDDSMGSGGRL